MNYRLLFLVVLKAALMQWACKSKVAVANAIFPTVEIGQQSSFIEGGYTAVGTKAKLAVDWLAHSPVRFVHLTVSPEIYRTDISGSRGNGKVSYTQTAYGLALGLHTRISEKLRLHGKIASYQGQSGELRFDDDAIAVRSLKEIAHSWAVIMPYSKFYRVGLGVQWSTQQVEVDRETANVGMNSVIYTLHNSWRI